MKEFPKNIKFKYTWRKYQQRVLDELQTHLSDKHLHVIAPPGSGKTVLGLEVAIQINQPTLILAPTIAIRNQWIHRFCDLFLQTNKIPDWISKDIRNPKFMTVVTYQGLHAACNNLKENEKGVNEEKNQLKKNKNLKEIIKKLQSQSIKTIVVDEAHHLKNEWWQTLTKVKEKIDPIIVGLTATPPYDVSVNEWERYISLNGPVDTEISVPELIIEGDLCPHQDYIHFSVPTNKEHKTFIEFRENIKNIFQEIKVDKTIIEALQIHSLWKNPTENLDWIYTNLSFYSACLIFLHSNNIDIPKIHLDIVGDKELEIPPINYEWMEILLDFYLFKEKEYFSEFDEHKKTIENKLRIHGAIENRKINFFYNKKISNLLTSSINKLNSIKEIVDLEYNQLGKDLRLVILSDYIRKEYFINESENNLELNKMGVIPIFEKLRRENIEHKKIGVLTGSLIIIPKNAFPSFKETAEKYGIKEINYNHVSYDNNYILIQQSEEIKYDIVQIITDIFQEGEIEILIGTKSLLGEGWDAPAINTLILATFVGSFVLSNQMRGRAIRTQNGNEKKTGNIWHLVCIDPTTNNGGNDLELLKRRFKSFVGLSLRGEISIENGIGRLNIPENSFNKIDIEKINEKMFSFASERDKLKQNWDDSLKQGVNLIEEIKIPFKGKRDYQSTKKMYFNHTIKNLIATLISLFVGFGFESLELILKHAKKIKNLQELYIVLAVFGCIGFIKYGRQTYFTLRLYLKYRDISKDIHQIANALLTSLIKEKIIKTERSHLSISTSVDNFGAIFCHLEGGTTFDKSTFINTLQEIINPIENPRYIIIRKNNFLKFIKQKDYHSVPNILGQNKRSAEYFENQWESFVGSCKLIYTRTIEGRKLLLQYRIKSLSANFTTNTEHINKWK